jgi:hypothetical protein
LFKSIFCSIFIIIISTDVSTCQPLWYLSISFDWSFMNYILAFRYDFTWRPNQKYPRSVYR